MLNDCSTQNWFIGVLVGAMTGTAAGAIKTESITYQDGDTTLEGYLAYDDAIQGKRPGVLIVHEWWGLTEYPKQRATMLAKLGYVAFALDMYGKGKVTDDPKLASQWSGQFYQHPDLTKRRFAAGLDVLAKHPMTDPSHIAAIGYCFGGGICLEAARMGFDLDGVVSFHGSLASNLPAGMRRPIKAAILVCHGGDDPHVPFEQVDAFVKEMHAAHANWQVNIYGGAMHSFTNPAADTHGIEGVRYNAQADHRSWQAMQAFFDEIFPNPR
jgi:dienelactone hydrolase